LGGDNAAVWHGRADEAADQGIDLVVDAREDRMRLLTAGYHGGPGGAWQQQARF
jgi:hypothetical protein